MPLRVLLGIVLCVSVATGISPAGEPGEGTPAPTPKAEPESPTQDEATPDLSEFPEIGWWAVKVFLVEEKKAVVLSGSAWVKFKQYKVEADRIVYFIKSGEVYAEGNVRLRLGESEIAAQVAYLNKASEQGYLVDAVVRGSMPSSKTDKKAKRHGPVDLPSLQDPNSRYAKATEEKASFLRSKDPYGIYLDVVDDPQARLRFVFKAQKVILHSRMHMSAHNAFVTTDDMAEPIYGLKVRDLHLRMREVPNPDNPRRTILKPKVIVGKKARLKIGPMVLPPFPTVTYDLTKHMGFMSASAGNSDRVGYYALYRIGFSLGGNDDRLFDPDKIYFDIDNRMKRGPGVGAEFRYQTGIRPKDPVARKNFERGRGRIRVYGVYEALISNDDDLSRAVRNRERRVQPKIDGFPRRTYDANNLFVERRFRDDAAPPSFGLDLYEDDARWLIDFGHHQPLRHFLGLNDIQLDFKYQRQSDRDFLLDYYPKNYLTNHQPEALVSARKAGDNFMAELLYRGNPQDFDGSPPRSPYDFGTFTVYEPALNYSLMPMSIGRGWYVSGAAQAARVRREFEQKIINQDDLEANRIMGRMQLERPFRMLGMTFRPHIGGQATGYDDSRDESATVQGALTYGIDVSSRIYGAFPEARNLELGLDGFRHVIEPRILYEAIGDTTEDPVDILDFDEVDDLRGVHRIRLALEQTFQTRNYRDDGTYSTRNFAGLNIWMDAFPRDKDRQRLLDGDTFDLLKVNGYLRVIDAVTFGGEIGYEIESGELETAVFNLNFDPGGRWRLSVYERFNFEDKDRKIQGSDTIGYKLDFQLSERWGLSLEQQNERHRGFLTRKGRNWFKIALQRRYGPLTGTISYRVDKNNNDSAFGFSLAPAFAYRNLVVPSQDLLVDPGEVDDDLLAPEERNFDPFNLIKKRKKKGKKKKKPKADSVPPPLPLEPEGKDASPATERETGESDRRPKGEAVSVLPDSETEPARPKLKSRPKDLDVDDWAAAAKTEATP